MKIISISNIDNFVETIRDKPPRTNKKNVQSILWNVKRNGDKAVRLYEKKFGGTTIKSMRVSKKEVQQAYSKVSKKHVDAIKISKKKLLKTESALKKLLKDIVINSNGTKITKSFVPIESVGCYVPGGLARYPTTVIMSVVPAKVAGVKRTVVVSPPNSNGMIDPLTLVAADICGVDEFYKTGGAQAVAALSYGTESIPKVDKIVGPGGPFVTTAKLLVSDHTPIDMVAGPTELGVIGDNSANPNFIAADLISQAEHSTDTLCYLITTSPKLANSVKQIIKKKTLNVKRSKIIKKSIEKNGFIAICKNQSDLVKLANKLAPEHLQVITKNSNKMAQKIRTAGLVLVGSNTPSSASDYLLGSNHILPTNGFGRVRGSLCVLDFLKLQTQIKSSKATLQKISKYMNALSLAEDLPNHYEAVRSRLE